MSARFTLLVFTTSVLTAAATRAATPFGTVRVATGLNRPDFVTAPPGDTDRLFIVEQNTAQIRILNLTSGTINATPFVTVSDVLTSGNEQGLLGLAFHPDYASNGYFYVNYTSSSLGGDTVIARYQVSANPDVANTASKTTILTFDQPFTNHNGGWIGFSPLNGYLHIATGDGGSGCDPGQRAQNTSLLLGKILRIDVDGDDFPGDANRNYAIPPDNPFATAGGAGEVFDYGLRNPYRCSFDRLTGDLYIGDVGQDYREEVSFHPAGVPGGINFGWDCMEGTACSNNAGSHCTVSGCTCNDPSLTLPIYDYNQYQTSRQAVTGGNVYRGCAIPDLRGTYFLADYATAEIWSFHYLNGSVGTVTDRTSQLAPPAGQGSISLVSSFGEDGNGELYICDLGGEVFKLVPTGTVERPLQHDYDNDGDIDLADLAAFDACLTGPEVEFSDCLCDVFDAARGDSSGNIDLRDFADFQGAFAN
ncbi:MAG TPA: PQQ-dependent sugar dehydrogenase [Phycisphaerae bacterium]|mgnify:CR=1 FL=1|nr:PQQ-dependent sugar dehydrogenase [Phycisphaerales bacterium]HRX83771.1 PQQ-dependent sugar dehydrogenase [Phycisphaerae bacterium]